MDSSKAKKEILELMKKYSKNKNETNENELISRLKEYSYTNINKDDNIYRFCWCTLSSYCGYCINSRGNIIVIESCKPIKHPAGEEIELKNDKQFLKDKYNIIGYKKLDTKNGYIINPDNSNSPYIKIVNREIKLATNEDIYKFMAGAGWLEKEGDDKEYKKMIDEKFNEESLEIHHINNNPNDNRVENLVYLPRSIHCKAHKYTDN